ncbi:MAG TPA: DUF4209 domain-containing protein [Candidatus Moranbacteria bacterium]|nr:DUF4209 domain-containing protein [Candidatus Moranbacteria bacterium]
MFVLSNDKGQIVEYPSIRQIDQETLEYWTKRVRESSKNPILLSRYADLVVDFSPKVLGKGVDIDLFQIIIDSNITICKKSLADSLDCKIKIKRALNLAIKINDNIRINEIKNTIIKLEKDIAIDDKPRLWGFSFKWLLLDFAKKITLADAEKNEIIDNLEEKLKRIRKDQWLAENAVSLLAEYYASKKDEGNLMRVLNVLENSLKANNRANSDALLKTHAYEQIHEIYRKYASRNFEKAKKADKRLSQEIGQLNLNWKKSLKEISIETKIKQKDIDNFLKGIFGENKDDKLEMIMTKIAVSNLPKKDAVKKQLDDVSSKYPMQFLCTKQVISDDGVPIAKLSTLNEDYDSHFQRYALQYIQFGSFFLSLTMNELRKQFSEESILEYFQQSVVFENENKEYLKRAISAYWDEDYLVASHLFNPLTESGIRKLIKICGGLVLKPNGLSGYDNVLLGGLLKNNQIFENVFSKSGHNVLFYFRLILTEKLGMNLRNDFAHGFGKKKFFGCDASDRLFHILIWLSIVRRKEK